jgi:2-methylaconitate cis-trans-isomerase PrpF
VGTPRDGGNIAVRYFTPQSAHTSMAVSGGCCLAAATLIPGTVAHRVAQGLTVPGPQETDIEVAIENPAGILTTTVVAHTKSGKLAINTAAYRRSAQILLRGHVPLYRASPALFDALMAIVNEDIPMPVTAAC